MEQQVLSVELREKTGKGVARKARAKGLVPGIVYGKGIEPVAVNVQPKELMAAIAGEGGQNHLISLKGGASLDGNIVIVADLQRDCIKGTPTHVDLHRINLEEKLKVQVPVALVGNAAGVKEGGLLDFAMHTLEVECLPTSIPEHFELDVTGLGIGHAIHVGDIAVPAGVKILDDPKASVVSVLGKAREEEAAAPAE